MGGTPADSPCILQPMVLPFLARVAAAAYYRVRYTGEEVPASGPVLLVANHPNSLLDPVLVQASARRPVRFLAKSTLFPDRKVGWLVRAAGAIPVYRRVDDPTQAARNDEMFRAVHDAIGAGDAIGIFPEGISHSAPALAPLKTGAARIALGAGPRNNAAFPIIPVGLVFRDKVTFRSEALVVVGAPVPWGDLLHRGLDDDEAVRELTTRIDDAIREQTINLEQWHDQPLVECAVAVWEASAEVRPVAAERIARMAITTRLLAAVRATGDPEGASLARDVTTHQRRLERLRLQPHDLSSDVGVGQGMVWAMRRVPLVLPLWAAVAVVGWLLFWVPYRLTGMVVDRVSLEPDARSTWKLMVGTVIYGVWVGILALIAWSTWGWVAGALMLLTLPLIGMAGLLVRERWRGAGADIRRFVTLRSRRRLVESLRSAQRELGARLDRLYQDFSQRGPA